MYGTFWNIFSFFLGKQSGHLDGTILATSGGFKPFFIQGIGNGSQ
jgi:hypothetical protein